MRDPASMLFPMSASFDNTNSIIFDFDYTLVDSSSAIIDCVSYAFRKMNLPVPVNEEICKTIGLSSKATLKALAQIDDQKSDEEFRFHFTCRADEVMLEKSVFLDGVKPVLMDLKSRGLELGIVSNKYTYRIEAFLQRENLEETIDIVVGFEDIPEPKPDPAGLLIATDRLGRSKNQTVYIGDSLVDAETASRAGVPFIVMLTGVTSRQDFKDYAPLYFLNNLRELNRLFRKP